MFHRVLRLSAILMFCHAHATTCLEDLVGTIPGENHASSKTGRIKPFTNIHILGSIDAARQAFAAGTLGPRDLIVVDQFPADMSSIPPVAGILTGTALPVGSHAADLTNQRHTPVVHIPNATTDPAVLALRDSQVPGKKRVLEVDLISVEGQGGTFRFRDATPEELSARPVVKLPKGKIDKEFTKIETVEEMMTQDRETLRRRYGEKTASLVWSFKSIPEGSRPVILALPIGLFFKFLNEAEYIGGQSLGDFITAKMAKVTEVKDSSPETARGLLIEIQSAIKACKIPPVMMEEIVTHMRARFGHIFKETRVRTSNAIEDSLGAGVFESRTLDEATHSDEARRLGEIEDEIKAVFASEYDPTAFFIRDDAGVDESNEGMGILMHPSRKDEIFTAVTKIRNVHGRIVMETVLVGGANSVTSPPPGVQQEIFRVVLELDGTYMFYKGGAGIGYSSDDAFFAEDLRDELTNETPDGIRRALEAFVPVLRQWEAAADNCPEIKFEWINTLSAATGLNEPRVPVPFILQVKTTGFSDEPPRVPAQRYRMKSPATFARARAIYIRTCDSSICPKTSSSSKTSCSGIRWAPMERYTM